MQSLIQTVTQCDQSLHHSLLKFGSKSEDYLVKEAMTVSPIHGREYEKSGLCSIISKVDVMREFHDFIMSQYNEYNGYGSGNGLVPGFGGGDVGVAEENGVIPLMHGVATAGITTHGAANGNEETTPMYLSWGRGRRISEFPKNRLLSKMDFLYAPYQLVSYQ